MRGQPSLFVRSFDQRGGIEALRLRLRRFPAADDASPIEGQRAAPFHRQPLGRHMREQLDGAIEEHELLLQAVLAQEGSEPPDESLR